MRHLGLSSDYGSLVGTLIVLCWEVLTSYRGILPIVIVFVGAENMFRLVRSVKL